MDVLALVESAAATRWQRQMARADAPEEWFQRWDAAELYYMETHRPAGYADFVVGGLTLD